MNLDKLICSTKPSSLGEKILCQRAAAGNWEAMAALVLIRTNLTEEEVLSLDDEDLAKVMALINTAVVSGVHLQKLAEDLIIG